MKRAKKIALAISFCMAATSYMPVTVKAEEAAAEETATYDLGEAIVVAERYILPGGFMKSQGGMGFLGNKDVMDIPFQKNNLTEKTLDLFGADPSQASTSILLNVPSVRTNSSTLYNDFSIRGQKADAYQFRVNGIPSMFSQTNMPMNFVESVDVTSGPGVGVNGVAANESAGGVINLITKRAGYTDITRYTTSFAGRGSWGNYIDVSRRFGKNKENGLRINAAYVTGDTAIADENVRQKNISINFDRSTDKSYTNLFIGYRDTLTEGAQRYFDFSNAALTHMPKAPNNRHNYSFEGERIGMRTSLFTLNHIQKVSDTTKLFINGGYSYNNGYDYLVPASSRLDVINDNGDFTRTINNEPYAIRNSYVQLGAEQEWNVGSVKNTLVVAWDKDWYAAQWGQSAANKGTITGNIHTGEVTIDKITENLRGPQPGDTIQYYGWSAVNTSNIGKSDITLGVHRHTASLNSSSNARTKTSATAPLFGVVYKPSDKISLFANHSESFHRGKIVGNAYNNRGDILRPAKTKSNEIGIKYKNRSTITSFSLFDMKQQAEFISSNTLTLNGDLKYRGAELTMAGKIAPKLNLMGGFMYLDSEYKNNNNAFYNGKTVKGTAKWNAVATLEYEARDDLSVWTRMVYTGKAPIYTAANRELTISSFTTFDLGVRYKTHINKVPVTLNATLFNVFDKDYWMARPTYDFGILGNPRTFALTAHFDI